MGLARMVRRSQMMRAKRVARRAASNIRFPKEFKGVIMYCTRCLKELRRIPDGEEVSKTEQQKIVDEHKSVCPWGVVN